MSPQFSFNVGAEYAFTLAPDYVMTPRLNYSYQSSQQASPSLDAFYEIKSRNLVSALVTLDHAGLAPAIAGDQPAERKICHRIQRQRGLR